MIGSETRHIADDLRQPLDIHGRHGAEPFQQLYPLQLAQEALRLEWRHRGRGQRGVFKHLYQHPAQPNHDQRAEQWIVTRADDHLDALRHHRLHQHAVDPRRRRHLFGVRHHRRVASAHFVSVAHVEADHAGLGLVRQIREFDLDCHRKTQR